VRSLPVFLLTRLLSVVAVVVTVTALTFLVIHVSRPETFQDSRPLVVQLLDHLQRVFLHFDFGLSWDNQARPVAQMLSKSVPADVALLAGGLVCGTLLGLVGGAICVARAGSLPARVLEAAAGFFIIAPVYWVGLMLILTFNEDFGTIPIPLFDTNHYEPISVNPAAWLQSMVVPWLVAGAPLAAMVLRMTRSAMTDVQHEDYLRTAVAKGLSRRKVLRRHALPAASAPALTLAAANMATLVTNVVLVEHAFSIPGIFRYTKSAMEDGNFPLIQGMTVAAAVMVVLANLAVDLLQAAIDPRVRQAS
jgi:peptide/nickel transport system permease protein